MSDKAKGIVITFNVDLDYEQLQNIKNTLRMIKGVADVKESVVNVDDYINRQRIKLEYQNKLREVFKD